MRPLNEVRRPLDVALIALLDRAQHDAPGCFWCRRRALVSRPLVDWKGVLGPKTEHEGSGLVPVEVERREWCIHYAIRRVVVSFSGQLALVARYTLR